MVALLIWAWVHEWSICKITLADGAHFAARKARENLDRSQDLPVEVAVAAGQGHGARAVKVEHV